MRFFGKGVVALVFLLLSLAGAQAGNCDKKHFCGRTLVGGTSFSVVVGVKVYVHPKNLQRQTVIRGCSPRQASKIASRHGIGYQTIYRSSRVMTVAGYKRGHRAQIRISRAPDCRILR